MMESCKYKQNQLIQTY